MMYIIKNMNMTSLMMEHKLIVDRVLKQIIKNVSIVESQYKPFENRKGHRIIFFQYYTDLWLTWLDFGIKNTKKMHLQGSKLPN